MIKTVGPLDAEIVVVGDQPTWDDTQRGSIFSCSQGTTIKALLKESGFNVKKILFINSISYRKNSGVQLTAKQLRDDADQHLIPIISSHTRKLIIAMGNNAICALGVVDKPAGVNSLRMKQLSSPYTDDAVIVATTSPFIIMKEPDEADDMMVDFSYAKRVYTGNIQDQVPMVIRDILKPDDIFDMLEFEIEEWGYPLIAYDHETDDKNAQTTNIVMTSFCAGSEDSLGRKIAYVWTPYDRMVALYTEHELNQFKEAYDEFYSKAGNGYDFIAFNKTFDDWVTESYLGHDIPGAKYDVMLMKWVVNKNGSNDLKSNTARYLGYPNYEAEVVEHFNAIKARRSKVLTHPDDFDTLKRAGVEPIKNITKVKKSESYRWPVDLVDKGKEGYALIDKDVLRLYCAYDSTYTRMLYDVLAEKIKDGGLVKSMKLRHRICKTLMRCEQRGFLMDVERNKEFEEKLTEIETVCKKKIQDEVYKINPSIENFNPASNDHLSAILFGTPGQIPFISLDNLLDQAPQKTSKYHNYEVKKTLQAFHAEYYQDIDAVMESLRNKSFDYERVSADIVKTFLANNRQYREAIVEPHNVYPNGLYAPLGYTKTGKPSCAVSILQSLIKIKDSEFLSLILMLRKAEKLNSTFVKAIRKKLDSNNVLHGRFNTIGTKTGRISSSNPNCQNFVSYIRGQLIPRPGYKLLEFDYSQAEVRAVAAYSGDKYLINALNSEDIHRAVAALVFHIPEEQVTKEQRRFSKTIVFGLIYGISTYKLSLDLGISIDEAEALMEQFFDRFPTLRQWLIEQRENAYEWPHMSKTPWGTQMSVRNVLSYDKKIRGHAERQACNAPIQGAAGELTLYTACEIMDEVNRLGWDVHLVNTTHDSCSFEVPEHLSYIVGPILDKDGNPKVKDGKIQYEIGGEFTELVREVAARKAPVEPIDKVSFPIDIELNDYWSGEPDLMKALDPRGEIFRWDLIKSDEVLDREDLEALEEAEEIAVTYG